MSSVKEEPKSNLVAQPQFVQQKLVNDGGNLGLPATSGNKLMPVATAAVRMHNFSMDGPSLEKEKSKGGSENDLVDARVANNDLPKKNVKRKSETGLDGGVVRSEKFPTNMGDEKNRSQKQAIALPHKVSPQTAASSFE